VEDRGHPLGVDLHELLELALGALGHERRRKHRRRYDLQRHLAPGGQIGPHVDLPRTVPTDLRPELEPAAEQVGGGGTGVRGLHHDLEAPRVHGAEIRVVGIDRLTDGATLHIDPGARVILSDGPGADNVGRAFTWTWARAGRARRGRRRARPPTTWTCATACSSACAPRSRGCPPACSRSPSCSTPWSRGISRGPPPCQAGAAMRSTLNTPLIFWIERMTLFS